VWPWARAQPVLNSYSSLCIAAAYDWISVKCLSAIYDEDTWARISDAWIAQIWYTGRHPRDRTEGRLIVRTNHFPRIRCDRMAHLST